jgi:hypothetical protein
MGNFLQNLRNGELISTNYLTREYLGFFQSGDLQLNAQRPGILFN